MKKISKYLLIFLSMLLAASGYLSSRAQSLQGKKEEKIFYLVGRLSVLNQYYSIGKYESEEHSLDNYKKMLSKETGDVQSEIESYNPRISRLSNWSTALLFTAIIGTTVVQVIEARRDSEKQN